MQLPFVMDEKNWMGGTLWSSIKITAESSIEDKVLSGAYGDLIRYLVYKESMEHFRKAIKECREVEKIDGYLKQYYTFCMGLYMRFFLERRNIKRLPGIAMSVCFPCIYYKKENRFTIRKNRACCIVYCGNAEI